MGARLHTHTTFNCIYFYKAQVLVVASAGNSAADFCPLYYNEDTTFDKILVGSTDRNDAASWFSNYGSCVHMQVFNPWPVHVRLMSALATQGGHPRGRYCNP